jgi:hypothetical protein
LQLKISFDKQLVLINEFSPAEPELGTARPQLFTCVSSKLVFSDNSYCKCCTQVKSTNFISSETAIIFTNKWIILSKAILQMI